MLRYSFLFGLFLYSWSIFAQEIKPRGYFSKDTVQIGEHVDFTIIVDYPRGMEILFPDSTFNFTPFEYLNKSYLTTVSDLSLSNDSVVYNLTTFQLDSIQQLSLPIFVIIDGDSTEIETNPDQLFIQQVITENVDSLSIKESIDYQAVDKAFNYPYLLIGIGILAVVVILIAVFFGTAIKKRYQLYRMRKSHLKFLERFKAMQDEAVESSKKAENILALWKSYLERLEGMPYTKLTTREIVTLDQNQELSDTLRSMDSNIYGDFKKSDIKDLVTRLKEFGIDRFSKKLEELKHA